MTLAEKRELHQHCLSIILSRIEQLQLRLKETQDAANNETKSSAGDKYETGRAMAQLEKEKLYQQLSETTQLQKVLLQINTSEAHQSAILGSVIKTDSINFFISISLGEITFNETKYFAVSPVSPIGKLLLGKTKGNQFVFNKNKLSINELI